MPALPADIGPALREAAIVQVADSAVLTRFPGARDGLIEPSEGMFDTQADCAAALAQRAALIGVVRRRFAVAVQDLMPFDIAAGVPTHRLIDGEQGVDMAVLLSRIEIDEETEITSLEYFG
ncbi:MAG: hypothetical protein U5M50_03930 [Sphingobium sp.]|nr:hypothetical protein [Sphingobium sp.]